MNNMNAKSLILFTASFVLLSFVKAQNKTADSLAVVKTLRSLLVAAKNENPNPNVRFLKAAPFIVYRGDDKAHAWRTFVNYKNAMDRKAVDETCMEINETVNKDPNYKITKYSTEKESEGIWHLLSISYLKNGATKNVNFAFLKIGNRFGLGDID
jgi:hypothetical protein